MRFNEDILKALLYISDLYVYNSSNTSKAYFDKLYHFTTEMIDGYYKEINFENKTVLTVMASGDHVLNAILLGAKKVDTFDINKLSIYYYKLKEAAIKSLSLEEFKNFFYSKYPNNIKCNDQIMNWKLYLKISPFLETKYKAFWDMLYLEFNGKEIGNSDLFWPSENCQSRLSIYNAYLTEEKYYKLKNILLENKIKVTFTNADIIDLKLNKKYDYIFLSNISQYLNYMYTENYLDNFNDLIIKLSSSLKDNGILFHSYLYACNNYITNKFINFMPNIYNHKEMKEKINNLDIITFDGYGTDDVKDAVYIYKNNS